MRQELVIRDWHPRTNPNGDNARRHWSVIRRNHDIDRDMAWASAKQAGWVFVPGRVKLTITLVYPRNTLPDTDNAYAKVKGLIDGLKHEGMVKPGVGWWESAAAGLRGFFTDDSTEWLELEVRAIVEKGCKAVRIELEPAGVLA